MSRALCGLYGFLSTPVSWEGIFFKKAQNLSQGEWYIVALKSLLLPKSSFAGGIFGIETQSVTISWQIHSALSSFKDCSDTPLTCSPRQPMLCVLLPQISLRSLGFQVNRTHGIYTLFLDDALSLSRVISKLIHATECINSLSLFIAESWSTVWMYHNLFNPSPADGHLRLLLAISYYE